MSIAHLLHPELSKLSHTIHTSIHEAFGLNHNFPIGEVLAFEETCGMLVHGVMKYPDDSRLIYSRELEDDYGTYIADGPEWSDHLYYCSSQKSS